MSPTAHPSAAIVEEDHSALIAKLTDAIGAAYVLTDAADMAGRLVEDRGLYTGTAIAILRPGSTDEVATCVRLCAAVEAWRLSRRAATPDWSVAAWRMAA